METKCVCVCVCVCDTPGLLPLEDGGSEADSFSKMDTMHRIIFY